MRIQSVTADIMPIALKIYLDRCDFPSLINTKVHG